MLGAVADILEALNKCLFSPLEHFCTRGFSTMVTTQRSRGCWAFGWLVLFHQGNFQESNGSWKISKHIPFMVHKSRQCSHWGPKPSEWVVRLLPWLPWQIGQRSTWLKVQLATGSKPCDLGVESTKDNDTNLPFGNKLAIQFASLQVEKWFCDHFDPPHTHTYLSHCAPLWESRVAE